MSNIKQETVVTCPDDCTPNIVERYEEWLSFFFRPAVYIRAESIKQDTRRAGCL